MHAFKMLCTAGLSATALFASAAAAQTVRQHGAHVHGEATLNLTQDGSMLALTLEAPGMSFLGFEHPPHNDDERKALANTLAVLKAPATWLEPAVTGGCVLESASAEPHGFGDIQDGTSAGKASHSTSEDEGHGHHEHADIDAEYHYTCHAPLSLRTIDVHLFERFPNLHKLNVNLVLPGMQGSQALAPGNTQVTLLK